MNDLQVVADQEVGKISWNFEELKSALKEEMSQFETVVYTDSNIQDAKKDVASLRKLSKEIDSRRIEIKKKRLEPYDIFEGQANELKAIIEKPITMIDEKVKDYEKRRRETVTNAIKEYFAMQSLYLEEGIRDKVFSRIWNDKWLNATTASKVWKEDIDKGVQEVVSEIQTISSMNGDFKQEALDKYKEHLNLNEALQYMTALQRQKQIAEEKIRKEQEEKSERERILAEKESWAAKRAAEDAEQKPEPAPEVPEDAQKGSNPQESTANEEIHTETANNAPLGENKAGEAFLIRLFSAKDRAEVEKYCNFNDIKYEVVE